MPTDMSSMGGCSVGAGDRDRSRKLDGLEKILESIGYGEGSTGVEHKGCELRRDQKLVPR